MKLTAFLGGLSGASSAPAETDWHATEPWVRFGMRTVTHLCGGLLIAAILLSVSGAVVSVGKVTVDGQYKAVQHLEGGIVSKILVHNGDVVKSGDVLLSLNDTQARANLAATTSKISEYAIQEARLIAERDLKERFEPPAVVSIGDADSTKLLDAQQLLFAARRSAYLGQKLLYKERVTQTMGEISGTKSQLTARMKERDINAAELQKLRPLYEQGYVGAQRMGALEREAARLKGEVGSLKAELRKLEAARNEAETRLVQADKEYSERAAEELQKVQAQLAEQLEAEKAMTDRLNRTSITAPIAGTVHALAVHTEGGVIQPGAVLMQIVPTGGEFLVEAKISPQDIDSVHPGQPASIRFSSFDAHTTPRLSGTVRKVSAAEVADDQGKTYFTAQVEVPPSELARLEPDQHVVPGMPAEVYLETRSRSILSYFLKPLGDMLARAFRET